MSAYIRLVGSICGVLNEIRVHESQFEIHTEPLPFNAEQSTLAFRVGQKKLAKPINPDDAAGAECDPDQVVGVAPKVINGVVQPKVRPASQWVVEVIGGDGRVDKVLGEFPTYRDASYCSLRWSEDHPDDLRLTREREVKLPG